MGPEAPWRPDVSWLTSRKDAHLTRETFRAGLGLRRGRCPCQGDRKGGEGLGISGCGRLAVSRPCGRYPQAWEATATGPRERQAPGFWPQVCSDKLGHLGPLPEGVPRLLPATEWYLELRLGPGAPPTVLCPHERRESGLDGEDARRWAGPGQAGTDWEQEPGRPGRDGLGPGPGPAPAAEGLEARAARSHVSGHQHSALRPCGRERTWALGHLQTLTGWGVWH